MDEHIMKSVAKTDALCKALAITLMSCMADNFRVFLKAQLNRDSNMGQIEDAMKIEHPAVLEFIRYIVQSHDLYSTAQFIWEMCRAVDVRQ